MFAAPSSAPVCPASPTIPAALSSSTAAGASPSPSASTTADVEVDDAAATSSSSSSSSIVQSRIDLHFDTDYARIRQLPAHKQLLRRKRLNGEMGQVCLHCNQLLQDQTAEEHKKVCKLPPPIKFPSITPQSTWSHAATIIEQWAGAYRATAWGGSQLIRLPYSNSLQLKPGQEKCINRVLRWIHSILLAMEGRDLEWSEDSDEEKDESEDGETKQDADEKEQFRLQPTQELWIYRMKDGSISCAVLVTTRPDLSSIVRSNDVPIRRASNSRVHAAKQKSISSFFATKTNSTTSTAITSAAAASSSASTTASSTSPSSLSASELRRPLFGIDKIAVHHKYRYGNQTTQRRTASVVEDSNGNPISLAEHVLHSILAYHVQHGDASFNGAHGDGSLPRARVAFSSPTDAGRKLAARLTRTDKFAIYDA